jgi:preprotein translocase subunit SecD|uniref:SecDF P1 head subdomain-containing protein n=2 Tax=Orrella sp. TaxID=1921583 RepID=UPI0040488936
MDNKRMALRVVTALMTVMLSGCGALWDLAYPPPPDPRASIGFYLAKTEPTVAWVKREGVGEQPALYLAPTPVVLGTAVQAATPMTDPSGLFYVAIRLNGNGTRKLAEVSALALGDQLALVIEDRLLGAALIDAPIKQGLFAMAVRDKNAAFVLSLALHPPE